MAAYNHLLYSAKARFTIFLKLGRQQLTLIFFPFSDSPGVPPSATAHELFRGFSYVAPGLILDGVSVDTVVDRPVSNGFDLTVSFEGKICNLLIKLEHNLFMNVSN